MFIESWLVAAAVLSADLLDSLELLQAASTKAATTGKTNCLFIHEELDRKGKDQMSGVGCQV